MKKVNKKVLSSFYHKRYFDKKMNVRHPFSIKNIFHDKMHLRRFYFHMTICSEMMREMITFLSVKIISKENWLSYSVVYLNYRKCYRCNSQV